MVGITTVYNAVVALVAVGGLYNVIGSETAEERRLEAGFWSGVGLTVLGLGAIGYGLSAWVGVPATVAGVGLAYKSAAVGAQRRINEFGGE